MSFSEDNVLSKFSTLDETQESIVGISQWILFHRRYAGPIADIWSRALQKAPANKKLSLIYLANEVVQQSRAKRKEEFVAAFADVIVESIGSTYRLAPPDTKRKIKRVVEVWSQRSIFPPECLTGLDESLGLGGEPAPFTGLGGSSFGDIGVPQSLKSLAAVQKPVDATGPTADKLITLSLEEYNQLFQSDALPAPPTYAQKLAKVQKSLDSASNEMQKSITARKALIEKLKNILEMNEIALISSEAQLADVNFKLSHTKETRKEVEEMLVSSVESIETSEPITAVAKGEEYTPFGNNGIPQYSPASSDEEDNGEDRSPKRQKTEEEVEESPEEKSSGNNAAFKGLEGLDPAVAEFLANMVKGK